jgi:hypothetical protein
MAAPLFQHCFSTVHTGPEGFPALFSWLHYFWFYFWAFL